MKIMLVAPDIRQNNAFYGGGTGGVNRNVNLFLQEFSKNGVNIKPCFHSVRVKNEVIFISLPFRLVKDSLALIKSIHEYNPDVVHIFGQYRRAIIREFVFCIICLLMRKKYVYQIRAGKFIEANKEYFHRIISKFILQKSAHILFEGNRYAGYLKKYAIQKATYFPNFVSRSEIPAKRTDWFLSNLKILFAGYCYDGKGIYELVEAASSLAENGLVIDLYLIGEEEDKVSEWLNDYKGNKNLTIHRLGRRDHNQVMTFMRYCDLYCYPSKHSGEGHNNSINEAMMNEMVIVSSKAGFLEDILANSAYMLEEVSKNEIIRKIRLALDNKEKSVRMAQLGRQKIIENYNSEIAFSKLKEVYSKVIHKQHEANYTVS